MTRFDDASSKMEQYADDTQSLNDLEYELASNEGRIACKYAYPSFTGWN